MKGKRVYSYLTFEQRKEIQKRYENGEDVSLIAEALGKAHVTIYSELKRGFTEKEDANGNPIYSAVLGQRNFETMMKRRGRRKTSEKNKFISFEEIKKAVRALGETGRITCIREIFPPLFGESSYAARYSVEVDFEYFGIYDSEKKTFVD